MLILVACGIQSWTIGQVDVLDAAKIEEPAREFFKYAIWSTGDWRTVNTRYLQVGGAFSEVLEEIAGPPWNPFLACGSKCVEKLRLRLAAGFSKKCICDVGNLREIGRGVSISKVRNVL